MSTENGDVIISQNPTDMREQTRNYLQHAQFALQETNDLGEIFTMRDPWELCHHYSRQQKYGIEIQNTGTEVKIQAERRMGELLREMKEIGEPQHGVNRQSESRSHDVTLNDLGINRMQSSRWQRSATLSKSIFEAYIREAKAREEEITRNAILAIFLSRFKAIIFALIIVLLYNPCAAVTHREITVNEQMSSLPPVSYCISEALNSLVVTRGEYKNWQKDIKWSHLLPDVQLRYGQIDISVNRFFKLEDGTTDNLDDTIKPRNEYQVLLIWELSEFAFSGKKAIAAEQQIRFDHLRIEVIEKVTKYYFELKEALQKLKNEKNRDLKKTVEINRSILNALANNCIGEKTINQ